MKKTLNEAMRQFGTARNVAPRLGSAKLNIRRVISYHNYEGVNVSVMRVS